MRIGSIALLLLFGVAGVGEIHATQAEPADKVRLAFPVKTYWSTVVAVAAEKRGLFQKEGIDSEITIYRSSGDAFQGLAAGAADFAFGAPTLAAAGRTRGVNALVVSLGNPLPLGWHLLVTRASPIQSLKQLEGKRVGITGTGSLSDLLARYAAEQ